MKNRITKVTTKRGDDGTTSSADGSRLSKSDNLIKTIGNLVKEYNSSISFILDLNQAYNLSKAIRFLKEVDRFNIKYIIS